RGTRAARSPRRWCRRRRSRSRRRNRPRSPPSAPPPLCRSCSGRASTPPVLSPVPALTIGDNGRYIREIHLCDILTRDMEALSATAYVILGMLYDGPKSGYEIKALVDNSTRFFWAASYGQIYPELKRLAEAGLVVGSEEPTGGRRRTVYEITADGEQELQAWLRRPPETFELRDEGLLKLFFAEAVAPDEAIEIVRGMREYHEAVTERLRALEKT